MLLGLLALVIVASGCDDDGGGPGGMTEPTITDLATDTDNLSTLVAALQATGLAGTLDDESATFTVFAPSNSAFSAYDVNALLQSNPALLEEVLGFHVVAGAEVTADELSNGDTFTTVQGDQIEVTLEGGNVFVEGAQVTTPDVQASNGVVHIIDDVLLSNRTAGQRLLVTSATEALYTAISDAGLVDAFNNPQNVWTTFAPTNAAFQNADLSGFTAAEVQEILQYHTLDGITTSTQLVQLLDNNGGEVQVPTNQGEDITVRQLSDGTITLNGDQATLNVNNLDLRASNGIIHLIDGVLVPPSLGEMPTPSIADIVANTDAFSTLKTALESAGLVAPLADETKTYTVFAPNNDAFGPINTNELLGQADALSAVLKYHVVPGQALALADLQEGENTVTTLDGAELTVVRNGNSVFVEGSEVVQADVQAANGIIHVIDRTLLGNQNLASTARFVAPTFELYQTVVDAGLGSAFVNADGWTVFGPNNATFQNADLSGFSASEIQEVLQYHVLPSQVTDSEALLAALDQNGGQITVTTLQGEDLTIAKDGDQVVFNGGQATLDLSNLDYVASNGILHVIDGLLIPPSLQQKSIAEIVADNGQFATLKTALQTVGLDGTLGDETKTFTVFAPNDASFAPYNVNYLVNNPGLLEEVLGFHVVQGAAVQSGDLSDGDTFTTVQGDQIEISIQNGTISVEGAEVITADIEASNGVIHVVDNVLLTNRNAVERATVTKNFSILADLVGEANLASALSGVGPDGQDGLTVFAPTNEAFLAALDNNGNGTIDGNEVPSNLAEILQYHVLDDVFFAADVPTSETAVPTLQGTDVTVVRSGSSVTINPSDEDASVIAPDVDVSNGVIHGIDTVLIP
ncbi:fasciclin domain-containing protein [Salisaeta longa]|uniref:fasciclin domain-containing protein n=1 Tax=Salisaeta longa TaxID=503170 RepID=UPI0004291073|nr:fasciclin domain-containing protein [Salisaeta longa]